MVAVHNSHKWPKDRPQAGIFWHILDSCLIWKTFILQVRCLYQSFFDPNPQIDALLGYKIATFSSLYFIFSGCYSLSKMQTYSVTKSTFWCLKLFLFYYYAGECIIITLVSFYDAIFTCLNQWQKENYCSVKI